ncbi:MAG: TRAP transporter small permease [Firmicutes bacterium]|jgi:C4-dicarboxylate transporter DctQ subunit|nr:TRAP transporter small permease [Bacillota bacterium]
MRQLGELLRLAEEAFCALGLLGATLLMFLNVVLRHFFSSGLPWSEELIRYTIIWITFIGIGLAARRDAHVAVDFFAYYMTKRQQRLLIIAVDVLCLIFSLLMIKYSLQMVGQQFLSGQKSPALQVPFYLIYLSLPIGLSLGVLRFSQDIAKRLAER